MEEFALAEDRGEFLEQLVPGTEDYYYYHCLHHQHTAQLDKIEALMPLWLERHGRTGRYQEICNRQALLSFDDQPEESLKYLRDQLDLRFDHQPEQESEQTSYPTRLDPSQISREALAAEALHGRYDLDGISDAALGWLAGESLNADQRRLLMGRLTWPDIPELERQVLYDLEHDGSSGFGSMPIHRLLLRSQLSWLAEQKPDLLSNTAFVHTWLDRLAPGADECWEHDPRLERAYLDRLWEFVGPLDPAFNSLKAHVLYHLLALDRSEGTYSRSRFTEYLRLPRQTSYTRSDYLNRDEHRYHQARLGEDFSGATELDAVGDDQELVDDYLAHFFAGDDDYKQYELYIRDTHLRRVFATTKILAGEGDMERWYSMLDDPGYYQALKERVDIEFAPQNSTAFAGEDAVSLDVQIKNVETLVVKVFEINTLNYHLARGREVDASVDLDGLVARREETHTYDEPPLRRVRRTFDFPSLDRPGVFVIEMIGNGKSSRALVRKGGLHYLERLGAAGHVITILDEHDAPATDATFWLGGREYRPNDSGKIVVPFSTRPGRQDAILRRGDLSSMVQFTHRAEVYSFRAGIHVDRESLIKGATAKVLVRPSLTLNGVPVSLELLEEPRLVVESTDRHDVSSSMEVPAFALKAGEETVHELKVPDELASLCVTVRAKVKNLSKSEDQDLSDSRTFQINGIDATNEVEHLHLGDTAAGKVLWLLGKSGEPRAGRPINIAVQHRFFTDTVHFTLQTDERGRVELGSLDEVDGLAATSPSGVGVSWRLRGDACRYQRAIHARAGEDVTIPYMGSAGPAEACSLLQVGGDGYDRALPDQVTMDDGLIRISGLEGGDYELLLREDGTRVRLRVARGTRVEGHVISRQRVLQARATGPLQIREVSAAKEQLRVRLANAGPRARVHVVGTRFLPAHSLWDGLGWTSVQGPRQALLVWPQTDYLSGRDIGDEYRYILERKYAKKYPGNMLVRPGLLLNPWAVRDTGTGLEDAKAGEAYGAPPAAGAPAMPCAEAPWQQASEAPGEMSNLDFLARPSVVLPNLVPDEQGVVCVPLEELAGTGQVRVLALDDHHAVIRGLALPEEESAPRDLRLDPGLDPEEHFTEKKEISVLGAGDRLEVADITTSSLEVYGTLGRVHSLYQTLTSEPNLERFSFVTRWPELAPEEQRELYSEHACHELSFFLSRKDPAFFEQVIRPALANKKDKTFLDHYLLDHDLSAYLEPWAHGRLNVVEQILLAGRVEGQQGPGARHVADLCDLLPPDVEGDDHLFRTALRGSALETGDDLGMDQARAVAKKESKKKRKARARRMEPPGGAPMMAKAAVMAKEREVDWDDEAECEECLASLELDDMKADLTARADVRQLYQTLDKTKEWAENNYYKLPLSAQGPELVTENAFWRDLAEHEQGPFLSPHFARATRNFTEMMLALSVLDLPFSAGEHAASYDGARMTLKTGSAAVVFHKEIKPVSPSDQEVPILVSQNYFREDDRYRYEGGESFDKYVRDEFLLHTVYLCQVVLTNPTSSRQKLDLLLQIPRGSVPVDSGFYTRSRHLRLESYATEDIEYSFYFPRVGTFDHFPVHVTRNEALIASAPPARLNVVSEPSEVDEGSWSWISQRGTGDQVLAFLRDENLGRHDLERIAWRMRDEAMFRKVLAQLRSRHVYDHTLWSYSLAHRDLPAARQYLLHSGLLRQCGYYLESPLLDIDATVLQRYEHLEYAPLVNARAHALGGRHKILNDRFSIQYEQLMTALCFRPSLTHEDRLAVAYYLLLQDRVEEGLEMFASVDRQQVAARMQYDYVAAYASFFGQDPEAARQIAEPYRDYPVDRWRDRFRAVLAQLDEATGEQVQVVDEKDHAQRQASMAATQPGFELSVEDRKVTIDYQNLRRCRVSYYRMDIELLFSRQPFVQQQSDQFSFITPNRSDEVQLPEGGSTHTLDLPSEYHSANVVVEVVAEGIRKSQAYYAHRLQVQVIEHYGQVQVLHKDSGSPLPRVYVKAYARTSGGEVRFFKDGYTDLRGRFDYASLSTNELDRARRFALLIISEEHGAVIREADPPKR